MMAGEMDTAGEFWLPSDFLSDDFFLDGNKSPTTETESENEEDYMAGLTKKMAHSFLYQDDYDDDNNNKPFSASLNPSSVLGTSPQSTLCGIGSLSFSSNGSPDGPSQVSSPPSTPFQQPRDDALDLLYAAAGQVVRLGLHDANFHGQAQAQAQAQAHHHHHRQVQARGLLGHPHQYPNPIPQVQPRSKTHHQIGGGGLISNQDLIQQQLQAARFYQLKRQQLLKQQYVAAAALGMQHNREKSLRPLGLSTSAWPPLQKQHQSPPPPPQQQQQQQQQPTSGSGMTAVFLNGCARRQSTGTGVFLPRRIGTPNEARKKQACSTVLLPARVVQALNLNLDEMGVHSRVPGSYMVENDGLMGRSVAGMNNYPKRSAAPAPATSHHHEVRLPQEWTY